MYSQVCSNTTQLCMQEAACKQPRSAAGTYQGLAMMEVANNSNISDQLRVIHEASQKLIAVVCLERLLLQHLCLFGSDGGNDGHLHVTEASVIGQQQHVQNVLDVG